MKHRHIHKSTVRGTSLIEGMIATAVFLIGMTGIIQFTLYTSSLTSDGVKKLRASAMSSQIRVALDTIGHAQLTASGGLFNLACSTDTAVIALADGIQNAMAAPRNPPLTGCVIDLDAYEKNPTTGYIPLAQPLSTDDAFIYKRVLVYYPSVNAATPQKPSTTDYYVAVVISYKRGNQRFYVKQSTLVLDPRTYSSSSPI